MTPKINKKTSAENPINHMLLPLEKKDKNVIIYIYDILQDIRKPNSQKYCRSLHFENKISTVYTMQK